MASPSSPQPDDRLPMELGPKIREVSNVVARFKSLVDARENGDVIELELRLTDAVTENEFKRVLSGLRALYRTYPNSNVVPFVTTRDYLANGGPGSGKGKLRTTFTLSPATTAETLVGTILKIRVMDVDIPEYRARLSLSSEKQLDSSNQINATSKEIRQKKRMSFFNDDIRVDMTVVNKIDKLGGSNVWNPGAMTYEIEVEYVQPAKVDVALDLNGVVKRMLDVFNLILSLIDGSRHVLSLRQTTDVHGLYTRLTSTNAMKFVGFKPVTLESTHLATTNDLAGGGGGAGGGRGSLYVNTGTPAYTVTEKVDGLRHLLLVDSSVYSIDDRCGFKMMARVDVGYRNTLLDCEIVTSDKGRRTIYVFDAYYIGGERVSTLPLLALPTPDGSPGNQTNTRLHHAAAVVSALRGALHGGKGDIEVVMKEFKYCGTTPENFAFVCNSFLSQVPTGYTRDGLIFTPALEAAPLTGKTWSSALKWKPEDQNSIDFQVQRIPASDTPTHAAFKQRVGFNAANVLVSGGAITSKAFLDGRAGVRVNDFMTNSTNSNFYEFGPFQTGGDDSVLSVAIVPGNKWVPLCGNGDAITDDVIVECSFSRERHCWVPMRVRKDKLVPNNWATADNVWRSIQYPLTAAMMIDHKIAASVIDVYQANGPTNDRYYEEAEGGGNVGNVMSAMRSLHNKVKGDLLLKFSNATKSLFDFGVGRAGDFGKWLKMARLELVVGIDKSTSNLSDPDPSISSAYFRLCGGNNKRARPNAAATTARLAKRPRIVLLPMDASTNVTGTAAIAHMGPDDKEVAEVVWGHRNSSDPKLEGYYQAASSGNFDLATCMFAVHYMFENASNLKQFCKNVGSVLKSGGYFVGTCLDGGAVRERLKNKKEIDGASRADDGKMKTTWSIKRLYDNPALEARVGDAINVFVASINQELEEYIVDYAVLVEALKTNAGVVPLTDQEAADLNLPGKKTTDMFSQLPDFRDMIPDPAEKEYSSMHRWFVFKKT
jgi:SAM-dependent methyltransferase